MVGIFSRFSTFPSTALRRSRSSLDEKEISGIVKEVHASPPVVTNGAQVGDAFAPIDHPREPPEHDHPVRCPPPEPCIIHDGRLWKERLQLSMRRRKELPFMKEEAMENTHTTRRHPSEHSILPSMSAPENTLTKLLEL